MATLSERKLWNALKFGTTAEVNTKEGEAFVEGLPAVPPKCSEVGAPQGERDGATRKISVSNPTTQCPRTKLLFDILIEDDVLD